MSDKRTLYVGGLDENVTEDVIRHLFTTFGEVMNVDMPTDVGTYKNRGFAFVEFADPDDAEHAMDNMNDAEFYGKVLRVNYARQYGLNAGTAIWDTEEYLQKEMESKLANKEEKE